MLLMITSASHSDWLLDVPVTELDIAGLNKPCVVRMKSLTLDNGLLLDRAGRLGRKDSRNVLESLNQVLLLK